MALMYAYKSHSQHNNDNEMKRFNLAQVFFFVHNQLYARIQSVELGFTGIDKNQIYYLIETKK